MDLESMTPDEIRDYAARKEAVELHRSHLGEDAPRLSAVRGGRKPWERDVEVDGVAYTVDMRRFKSREFVRRAARVNDDSSTFADKLEFFDYLFEPMEDQILAEVERRVAFEDYGTYYDICSAIFEAVEAKN